MKFEDRQLNPGQKSGFTYKYLWRLIKWIDGQELGATKRISLQFFDQELCPLDSAGEILNPILCCFKDGTFMYLPTGFYGEHARYYLGPRYVTLRAWACLPVPECLDNPGNACKRESFYTQTNTIIGEHSHRDLIVADFYFIWKNGLPGATALASALASLWKKGYDTISSLGSALTKSLNSCVTNSENLNCTNIPDIMSSNTSSETEIS